MRSDVQKRLSPRPLRQVGVLTQARFIAIRSIALSLGEIALGQKDAASVVRLVEDPSDAVVPGAQITITVAKLPECPDHSDRAYSFGLFAHRRAALLIANAFIQNHPDQLTETMRNRPDGFVVAETRNETTVDDLEDAFFTFDGSIGGPVLLRRPFGFHLAILT